MQGSPDVLLCMQMASVLPARYSRFWPDLIRTAHTVLALLYSSLFPCMSLLMSTALVTPD